MKIMVFANLDVGGLPGIDLPSSKVAQWQLDKVAALSRALNRGAELGAKACIIAGGLFAKGFVAQSLVEASVAALRASSIPVTYLPYPGEAKGLESEFSSAGIVLCRPDSSCELELNADSAMEYRVLRVALCEGLETLEELAVRDRGAFLLKGESEAALQATDGMLPLGRLEPVAFGEGELGAFVLAETQGGPALSYETVPCAVHPFKVHRVTLGGLGDFRSLAMLVGTEVKDLDRASCLRIELEGRLPLDVYINTEELSEQIGRYFFYVEVINHCVLDLDLDGYGTDVSLLAEFIRQVTGDDSLSETEKTRVLRCGWNVLNGKEPVE